MEASGTFSVETTNITLIGSHELWIIARLANYPAIVTSSPVILPLEFVPCHVTVDDWKQNDVTIPSSA